MTDDFANVTHVQRIHVIQESIVTIPMTRHFSVADPVLKVTEATVSIVFLRLVSKGLHHVSRYNF